MAGDEQQSGPISILIAEDLELVRFGIKFALEKEARLKVVGEAENGEQVLSFVEQNHPQVVLMDVGMPVMDGMEATRLVKERYPETKIVMLTSRDQSATVYEALAAGADAYCLKGITVESLLPVLDTILANHLCLDANVAGLVLEDLQRDADASTELGNENITLLYRLRDGEDASKIAETYGWTVETFYERLSGMLKTLARLKEASSPSRRF